LTYDPRNFPPPRVPDYPVLEFGWPSVEAPAEGLYSMFDAGHAVLLTSGRISIAAALDRIGVQDGDNVLLPAYNCRAMVEPVLGMSVEPRYYRLGPDLAADLNDIEPRLDARTKALLVVHYFGFPQDMESIRAFCDRHDLILIEDCAQCFFGAVDGRPPGSWGDFAIGSLMKFFPVYDGGCLLSSDDRIQEKNLSGGGLKFELKVGASLLERSIAYHRLRPLNWLLQPLMWLKDAAWSAIKARMSASRELDLGPNSSDGGFAFERRWLNIRMSATSRAILRLCSQGRITRRRRENYLRYLEQLGNLPGCRALFPDLPASVVPYAFPLLIDSPERVFPELKSRGVPIFRWEDIEPGICDTSSDYAQRLLQFPCHHTLRNDELDWIAATVRSAVTA